MKKSLPIPRASTSMKWLGLLLVVLLQACHLVNQEVKVDCGSGGQPTGTGTGVGFGCVKDNVQEGPTRHLIQLS